MGKTVASRCISLLTINKRPTRIRERPVPSDKNRENNTRRLVCMRDNVSVPTENVQCPHPSSSCPFRELCEVREAMRRKKDLEIARNASVDYRGSSVFKRRKKP